MVVAFACYAVVMVMWLVGAVVWLVGWLVLAGMAMAHDTVVGGSWSAPSLFSIIK